MTNDDIKTMRILFNADIEELCNQKRWNDAKEMEGIRDRLIQALESKSEDCISRKRAIEIASGYCHYANVPKELAKLPSVTPMPKTGHWIDIMVGDMPAQACDQCKTFYPLAYTGGWHNYCPNCGAKMERSSEE